MMRPIIIILSFLFSLSGYSQALYKGENGKVRFFSSAPLEDIEATTNKTSVALNASSGEVAVLIPIKSFVFAKSLMQEHFNENYLESDKYPDATLKGKITEKFLLSPGQNIQVNVSADLTIHGVSQHRDIPVNLKVNTDGLVSVAGKFNVKVADHKVKVPSIVFKNIAEVVEVTFNLTLKPVSQQ